jgi:shikimate dehydrogenase/3-dehydroquinate dehydratase type I
MISAFYKNIALIGMRCTGKSGIGSELAKRLGFDFIDLDSEIEKMAKKTVAEITDNGTTWAEFRSMELALLKDFISKEDIVISCGGGVGVNECIDGKNGKTFGEIQAEILQNSDKTCRVWLRSETDKIIKRYKEDKNTKNLRPKITDLDIESEICLQNFQRASGYRKIATFSIDTTNAESSFFRIISDIKDRFYKKHNAVIGFPVAHSLSPDIHNTGYKIKNIDDKFRFISISIKENEIDCLLDLMVENNLWGLSVTTPLKTKIMQFVDKVEPCGVACNAINTVIRTNDNTLIGYNTDYIGIMKSLECDNLKEKKVAILGYGGAGRAAAFGLKSMVKKLTIFVRKIDKHKQGNEHELEKIENLLSENFDIIINATSCGHKADECPISTFDISEKNTVFDLIYQPLETKLIRESRKNGAKIIYGTEMLLNQAIRQFELQTNGAKISVDELRGDFDKIIGEKIAFDAVKNKIFISLKPSSISDLEIQISRAKNFTNNIEIRSDYIPNILAKDVEKIAEMVNLNQINAIFTLRKKRDGGFFESSDLEYKSLMKIAYNHFNYIDIDLLDRDFCDELNHFKSGAKVIISYHAFQSNYCYEDIVSVVDEMVESAADIYKVALMIDKVVDISVQARILSYYKDYPIAVVPMGDSGLRASFVAANSALAFACIDDGVETASGQLSYSKFLEMVGNFFK